MSGFLRNIARRAAGLPAEAPVAANVAPALDPAALEVPAAESAAAPVQAPRAAPPASTAPVPIQRRAEAPAPAAPVAAYTVAPSAVPTLAPPASPVPFQTLIAPPIASLPAPVPVLTGRPATPAPVANAVRFTPHSNEPAAVPLAPEPKEPAAALPEPVIVREQVVAEAPKTADSPAPVMPAAVVRPAPIQEAVEPPAGPVARVEHTHRETVLKEIIERIYATEPAPLQPATHTVAKESVALQPRPQEIVTAEPSAVMASPRIEPRAEVRNLPVPEKRTVNVRIGRLELNLASPAPISGPVAPPEPAFDGFEYMRTYRI